VTRYARVIVDVAHSQVDRLFDYILPEGVQAAPGSRVRVPFGPRHIEGYVLEIAGETEVPPQKLRQVETALDPYPVLLPDLIELARWMKERYYCLLVDALRLMIPAQMRENRVKAKEAAWIRPALSPEYLLEKAQDTEKRAPRQAELLRLLAQKGETERAALPDALSSSIPALVKKGWVTVELRRELRGPSLSTALAGERPAVLTGMQRLCLGRICAGMGRGGRYLLHGVTGSGKTEVYLQAAQEALKEGKGVIILVPEISLTPQMIARITERFGDRAAVLHSRLSPGERYDQWCLLREGKARVAVGARSAVFAPVQDLGLLVVDEEHENSYYSEHTPRYGALEVAEERCRASGAALVAGSATPSVELYARAEAGEYEILTMPARVGGARMPRVKVVDMRRELAMGNRSVLSGDMAEELDACFSRGEQAMLFLNRRGFAGFVSCRTCGEVIRCDNCDVSMTYHRSAGSLSCHYCGAEKLVPSVCPVCGSRAIRFFGDGTEKLEEQMQSLFPRVRRLRMDADTTRGKDAHEKILEAFARREAQVLIGTQMITKGLDFSYVTMVGVVAADLSLFFGDGLGGERTFQLISQVCGRAGRKDAPGVAVVQTYVPGHYAIQYAARHDYEGFYRKEMEFRRDKLLPPFSRVMRIVVSQEDEEGVLKDLAFLREKADLAMAGRQKIHADLVFLDAMKAPAERIRGMYRYQLLCRIRPGEGSRELEAVFAGIAALSLPSGSHAALEIEPRSMI